LILLRSAAAAVGLARGSGTLSPGPPRVFVQPVVKDQMSVSPKRGHPATGFGGSPAFALVRRFIRQVLIAGQTWPFRTSFQTPTP
jgi:hypothetical protein